MRTILNNHVLILAASLFSFSCNGFLDKEPESALTPDQYLSTDANLGSYALDLYNMLPSHGQYSYGTFEYDKHTDNMAYVTPSDAFAPGYWKVGQTGGAYDFSQIYRCNYFLDIVIPKIEAGEITGTQSNIEHYLGEVYFFRAFAYFEKLKSLGDFPIVKTCLEDDMEVLRDASKRAPRNEVARFIIEDLDKAIELLGDTPPSGGKNRLNKACARLFKSRVALYEGTWLKYFKGTAFVPGGKDWPGTSKDYNVNYTYPLGSIEDEIVYFLTEAMNESKMVADAYPLVENTGKYQNTAAEPTNPYYDMFASINMESYSEVMLYRSYDSGLQIDHAVSAYASRANNGCGTTKSMVDAFLMANGKPIYAEDSGYPGDSDLMTLTKGRDSRLVIFLKKPGDNNFHNEAGSEGVTVEPWPDITSGTTNLKYCTGYALRKGKSFDGAMASFHDMTGSIVFRAVEAYLNYIEACYEKTGAIDAIADGYWRDIRRRALIEEDYNVTIASTDMNIEAASDWGAYSAGNIVEPTLYNIRRERRCELIAEGFRNQDIRRWRSLDQMIEIPYHVLGMNLWENVNLSDLGTLEENKTVSSRSFSKYLAPYHISDNNRAYNGYKWKMAHYLDPIAVQHFLITGNGTVTDSPLYQNPGWPVTAGEGAEF